MEERVRRRWFSAVCVIPWLTIAAIYIEACVARIMLSRWPRPYFDDPKRLPTAPLHFVFCLLFGSLAYGGVPLLIALGVSDWRKLSRDRGYVMRFGAFVLGLTAITVFWHFDPGRIWDWSFD